MCLERSIEDFTAWERHNGDGLIVYLYKMFICLLKQGRHVMTREPILALGLG